MKGLNRYNSRYWYSAWR